MSKSSETSIESIYPLLFHQGAAHKIVFTASPPYTFVEVTDSHLKMTATKREQVIGHNFFDVFPDTSEQYLKTGHSALEVTFKKVCRTKKQVRETIRYDIQDEKGKLQERYWRVTHCPIGLPGQKPTHILQISNEVTSEVLAQRDYHGLQSQLRDALAIGKVGSWVWDLEKDVVVADQNLAKMFGIPKIDAANGLSIAIFEDAIHPEDRPRVHDAIGATIADHRPFDEEYRTYAADGAIRWVLARGSVKLQNGSPLFTGVMVDVTERRTLQAEVELGRKQDQLNRQASKILQTRNDELEALARTKDEFVALASHQLRTPATAVKQYLGMVLQGYAGDVSEVQTEMLSKAFESNERQIKIIAQILNAARVDTGRLALAPVIVDLRTMVQAVAADLKSVAEERGHTIRIAMPPEEVLVAADQIYLRMAIENVLHNALIYTPEKGVIKVKLNVKNKECALTVTDNGVGIKQSDIDKLFIKFSRIHNPLSVSAGGSGIGLFLAAEIVRLHGGDMSVKSKIKQGTTFAISLPLVQNTT